MRSLGAVLCSQQTKISGSCAFENAFVCSRCFSRGCFELSAVPLATFHPWKGTGQSMGSVWYLPKSAFLLLFSGELGDSL